MGTSRRRRDRVRLHQVERGCDWVDDRFQANWRGAGDAGLDRGAYHYFTLCTSGSAPARNFLAVTPPDPAALPPAVDLELAGNCSRRPDPATVDAELGELLSTVEAAWGRDVVLYVGDDFERPYPVRERLGRLLWHRRFLLSPDVDGWWVWQLHGLAHVEGITGGVDFNVMRPSPDAVPAILEPTSSTTPA